MLTFVTLQSCKDGKSSGSRNPRERAVSLLCVVQNLLERSNEDSDPSASNEPNTNSTQQESARDQQWRRSFSFSLRQGLAFFLVILT